MPSDGYPYGQFGKAVSLMGRHAVVAAATGGATGYGAAYLFAGSNAGWTERATFQASDGTMAAGYGFSVSPLAS
jgi:hypothetical protein